MKLLSLSRILARDAALTIGVGGGNISRGDEEHIARFYDQTERVYAANLGLWDHERLIIERFFPKSPSRILDVGCGAGRTTGNLANLGYQMTGIDLSQTLISRAKERYPEIDFRVLNATTLPFPDNAFDGALFSHNGLDSVAPVAVRMKVLTEILRVVRPGGRFYLSGHNLLGKLKPEVPGIYGHVRWAYDWTHRIFRQLTKLNGGVFGGYWWYHDVTGWELLYSASPRVNLRRFREVGWKTVAVLTRDLQQQNAGFSLRHITHTEHHVQYVLEKTIG
jgi:ubiquinone/menaquinone biosynthesis C-methylase UbiE